MLLQAQTPTIRHRSPSITPFATRAVLTRAEIDELAGRLLQARTEAERDHLLAVTLIHAAHRAGAPLSNQVGRTLGASLKMMRRAAVRPDSGTRNSLELETLAQDDRAFDAARGFVRLAAQAAADAAWHPRSVPAMSGETFEFDPEMEYFLGGLVRSAGRVLRKVGNTVSKVSKVVGGVPVLGDIARAGVGAARLGLGSTAIAFDVGNRLARGQKLGTALKGAVTGQIDAVRSQLKLAEMVAPFVPGIGSGVAAALGAANALAAGKPITEALISAARSSLPGGAVAQAAFDTAVNLARGQSIGDAALGAVRDRLPGGPAARAAFDGAMALAHGKKLQDAAYAAAGRILPPSPYAADALSFVRNVSQGRNIQKAALSVVGRRAMRELNKGIGRELEQSEVNVPRPRKPGKWVGNLNGGSGTEADRAYQRQITGRSTALDYRVKRGGIAANFDGFKQHTLLDAKFLPGDGGVVRMHQWMVRNGAPPPDRLKNWADQQVEEARRQLHVANGVPVSWHVSSPSGASVIRQLLRTHNLLHTVHTPGITVTVTPAPSPSRHVTANDRLSAAPATRIAQSVWTNKQMMTEIDDELKNRGTHISNSERHDFGKMDGKAIAKGKQRGSNDDPEIGNTKAITEREKRRLAQLLAAIGIKGEEARNIGRQLARDHRGGAHSHILSEEDMRNYVQTIRASREDIRPKSRRRIVPYQEGRSDSHNEI